MGRGTPASPSPDQDMLLTEALMERKDTKTRMESLKKRLHAVAKTEEGQDRQVLTEKVP